jgi:hypothetical protein
MKGIYKTSIIAASLCLLFAASGCVGDFGEINKNPNTPYSQDLSTAEQIAGYFPSMINTILHSQQNRSQHTEQMVGQFGGHIATSANWNGTNFANFNPQLDWIEVPWTDGFAGFYSNYLQVRKLTESQGYIYHLANIIRVASQHRIADIYGPIPYSQVGTGGIAVGYDSVKDVYVNMINDLTESIDALTELATTAAGTAVPIGNFDDVYQAKTGSLLAKWVKYANSLKLRLAVRIALKNDPVGFAAKAIEEVMTHPIGPILANADNAVNSGVPENETPGYYAATGWGDVKMNATLTTYMNALNDPRTTKYMKAGTSATPYDYTKNIGIRMGAAIGETNMFYDYDIKPELAPETYSIMNVTNPEPVLLFCAAETYFLLAEANVRGWYTGAGSAQELYETGIQRSMEQYGVSIGSYMSAKMTKDNCTYSDPRVPGSDADFNIFKAFSDLGDSSEISVAWADQTTDEQRIEAIITQKWIANYKLGIEAWSEWRRTGYPRIFPGINDKADGKIYNPTENITISGKRMMRRLPYPDSEKYANPNYADAVAKLGGTDDMQTELWWALGNQATN